MDILRTIEPSHPKRQDIETHRGSLVNGTMRFQNDAVFEFRISVQVGFLRLARCERSQDDDSEQW
jgi:hypothetical protein